MENNTVKFIDLFAGLGGIRLGFENAFKSLNFKTECVMTSEIKPYAVKTLKDNFEQEFLVGDIFDIRNEFIPDFDFLLGGFPCQPFSSSGKRQGFVDTRGTLFFEIERILKEKKPYGFILENVEGLVKHDLEFKTDKIGKTLSTILDKLQNELNYNVSWKVFDSLDFGLPQSRKRIFIVGTKNTDIDLNGNEPIHKTLDSIFENGLDTIKSDFVDKILTNFDLKDLYGKSIKDKRGGDNNIHSWDIGAKGSVSDKQIVLLNKIFKERRKKQWALEIGIDWMDGMPLTFKQIATFTDIPENELINMLDDLTQKGYLKFEFPKKLVKEQMANGVKTFRIYDETKPKGFNIVAGKLSFEINKILNPKDIAPTLVATDVSRLAVPDGNGLRRLTIREGLRLFGYPEWYNINCKESDAFDLLGNTVAVPVVEFVASKLAKSFLNDISDIDYSTFKETPVCSL
ncbi:DNA (cytosine-5-)-methyltransferase [Flavobacterium sp. LB3R33]|uniref:DNA (cytosine-5-)-methyltransferase n=1 Tax=Flavobacterium sp. LB3R33 TaxID=3401721 RepID=UPI003AAC5A70